MKNEVRRLIDGFVSGLSKVIEGRVRDRVVAAMDGVAATTSPIDGLMRKAKKKAPVQLCPVIGCGKRAAPVFGMVCQDHKNLKADKIARYRKIRRYAKENGLKPESVVKNWDRHRKKVNAN